MTRNHLDSDCDLPDLPQVTINGLGSSDSIIIFCPCDTKRLLQELPLHSKFQGASKPFWPRLFNHSSEILISDNTLFTKPTLLIYIQQALSGVWRHFRPLSNSHSVETIISLSSHMTGQYNHFSISLEGSHDHSTFQTITWIVGFDDIARLKKTPQPQADVQLVTHPTPGILFSGVSFRLYSSDGTTARNQGSDDGFLGQVCADGSVHLPFNFFYQCTRLCDYHYDISPDPSVLRDLDPQSVELARQLSVGTQETPFGTSAILNLFRRVKRRDSDSRYIDLSTLSNNLEKELAPYYEAGLVSELAEFEAPALDMFMRQDSASDRAELEVATAELRSISRESNPGLLSDEYVASIANSA